MRDILRFRVVAVVLLALGLFAGTFANVGAQATPVVGTGTLVVSKFLCPLLEEATATVSDPVPFDNVAAAGAPTADCVADTAFFQVFAGADFASEPVAEFEAGQASVDLEPGTGFALLEPDQNVFFLFDIAADSVTTITVLNPAADKDAATPVAGDGDKDAGGGGAVGDKDTGGGAAGEDKDANGDGVVDDKDTGAAGADGDGGAAGEDGAAGADGTDGAAGADGEDGAAGGAGVAGGKGVSVLPSTGQGADAGTSGSAIALLLGAMSFVALAAGFAWRQRRAA